MKAKELMTKTIYSVTESQNLNDVAQLMWEHDCGWIPVMNKDNKILAVITDRDIAMAAYFNGMSLSDIPLTKVQSKSLVTCKAEDDISAVEEAMRSYQVRRIPVVNKAGKMVGIISLNDIALAFQAGRKGVDAWDLGKTLATICNRNHPIASASAAA